MSSSTPSRPRISPRIAAMRSAAKKRMSKESSDLMPVDPFQRAEDSKTLIRSKTALVHDPRMASDHFCSWDVEHIESPLRLRKPLDRLRELGLVDRCTALDVGSPAADDVLRLVHTDKHVKAMIDLAAMEDQKRQNVVMKDYAGDLFLVTSSEITARLAVAAAVDLVDAIVESKVGNGLALVRPPGHHAGVEEAGGFCIYNNVAIAAKHAVTNKKLKRVLIVDFDVHHGQGTQRIFESDEQVFYISIHRYDHGRFWPGLKESNFDFKGSDKGQGFTCNIPLNEKGIEDVDYLTIFQNLIMPLATSFEPELVIVSAGYDAAIGCPEGQLNITPMMYGHMIRQLMSLAQGKLAVILEGGYFIDSLTEGIMFTLKALLGDHLPRLMPLAQPRKIVVDAIRNVLVVQRPHWPLCRLQEEYSAGDIESAHSENTSEEMHLVDMTCYGTDLEVRPDLSNQPYDSSKMYTKLSEDQIRQFDEKLSVLKSGYQPTFKQHNNKVGLVHDEAMMRHRDIEFPSHPESPKRLASIMEKIKEFGLLEREELVRIESRKATEEELCLAHDREHVMKMASLPQLTQSERLQLANSLDSIYFCEDSYDSARLSCGSLLALVDAVGDETSGVQSGVAVIRPPGHHAEIDEACGFCLFNNVSVAAKYALEMLSMKRVLVFDWDVHHGNGIQNISYDDPRVLYISTHRYDDSHFFPCREECNYDYIGDGQGKGFNVNIPWNGSGIGDPEFLAAFHSIILPVAYAFDPDLVLISAGFDAAKGDPLGRCLVSAEMYAYMTHHLMNLANGKVILALEGGYNLRTISLSMTLCLKTLLGDPVPCLDMSNVEIKSSVFHSIRNVIRTLSPYWPILQTSAALLPDSLPSHSTKCSTKLPNKNETGDVEKDLVKPPAALDIVDTKEKLEEDKLSEEKKKDTYVPDPFGRSPASHTVYTLSDSRHLPSVKQATVLDSGYKLLRKTSDSGLEEESKATMARVKEALESSRREVLQVRRNSGCSYIPPEYGPSVSTSSVNTVSASVSKDRDHLAKSSDKPIIEDRVKQDQKGN